MGKRKSIDTDVLVLEKCMMDEALIQAGHSAEFVRRHLQEALSRSDPVAALVLLPMIEQAAKLEQAISALFEAGNARG